jgi:hypothetical protein
LAAEGKFSQARNEFLEAMQKCPSPQWTAEAIDDLGKLANVPGMDQVQIYSLIELL